MTEYIWAGALVVIGIGVFLVVRSVRRMTAKVSRIAFGTGNLIEGLRRQSELLETTPKSVSGMTKIFLPQIEKDFPEFNWAEFRHRTSQMLVSFLTAVDAGNPEILQDASEELQKQLELRLEDGKKREIREHYRHIQVHQTEIAGYRKQNGTCVVTLQSAVGYYHYAETLDGVVKSGDRERMEQTKYNTELVYIQDVGKLGSQATGIGVTCPNCGAPVTNLGSRICEYCGSGIREISIRVWALNRLYEVKN